MSKPVNVGILGIGGYALEHLTVLTTLHEFGVCRLVAAADPFAPSRPETAGALRQLGTEILTDPDRLIERRDIDAVFIATPLQLHTPQALAALAAGKHVYLEKPPCPTMGQWQQLVDAQKSSGKVFVVGFQMQTSPAIRFLKKRLVEGALGKLQTVWSVGLWRREDGYYDRSPWAARWYTDGLPVFDGPATNALAHVVHASLYLAGPMETEYAEVRRVRGSLKKARPVESYDTSYVEAETTSGASVRLAFTHATTLSEEVVVRCEGTEGSAEITWGGSVKIARQGHPEEHCVFPQRLSSAAALDFFRAINTGHRPYTRIQDTKAFVQAVNGALQSSGGSTPFPPDLVEVIAGGTPQRHYTVRGLDEQFLAFQSKPELIPPLMGDESEMPWVEAADITPELAVKP